MSIKSKPGRNARLSAGDSILVRSHWTDEWVEGTVRVPMNVQFSWTDKDGNWFYTRYDEDWKYAD